MGPDVWREVGGYVGLAVLGAYNTLQSRKANKQTKATGNGFAKHVKEDLAEIKDSVGRVEGKIDRHLEDHAEASLRGK